MSVITVATRLRPRLFIPTVGERASRARLQLAANQRPMVHVPLKRHSEQPMFRAGWANDGVGRRLDFGEADLDNLAGVLLSSRHDRTTPTRPRRPWRKMVLRRAAASVVELLEAVL